MACCTKEEAQETRERILDAAEDVFYAKGVSQTTLNDVAEAAGVTGGDREAGGLLEAGAREEHAVGEGSELRRRARPQACLADDGRHEIGGVAGGPQARHRPGDLIDRIEGALADPLAPNLLIDPLRPPEVSPTASDAVSDRPP